MNNANIVNLIKDLFEKAGISDASISISEDLSVREDGGITWIEAEISAPHLFLEHGGEGLSALNHIARKIIDAKLPQSNLEASLPRGSEASLLSVMIDINGFQKKKIENLRAVAHMMAERARYFKSNIEIDPMPPFERRVIHEFLSGAEDLKTESTGTGPDRRVIIKYIGGI